MVDFKYVNILNTTDGWICSLKAVIDKAIDVSKRVVVIAIARKMARLLEYYIQCNSTLNNCLKNNPDVTVITEHAIPFCLYNARKEDTEVVILDDMIVYGDTVETVYENVLCYTGIRAKIIAMAASDRFRLSLLKKNVVHPNLSQLPNPDVLSDSVIPAFTARNSWNIVSLCHPIDLEHTILRVRIKNTGDVIQFAKTMKKSLSMVFPDATVYIISHKIPYSDKVACSVSLVFRTEDSNVINSDFSKLRFFISEDELRIVSYSPNIWETPILEDDFIALFNTSGLSDIWRRLSDLLKSSSLISALSEDEELDRMSIEQDFKNRVELSAVVMANYLVSFDSLCLKKQLIEKAVNEVLGESPSFEIAEQDISLIVGQSLTKEIIPQLRNAFINAVSEVKFIDRTTLRPEILRKPLLPMFPETKYMEERILDIYTQINVDASLSLIFNRLTAEYGLVDKRREDRIKVGESFDSIYNSLSLHYKDNRLYEALHRWIDSRIDLGVVVPKYEFFMGPLGYKIWRRYFRAGEKEDILKDVARVAVMIIFEKFGEREFDFTDFVDEVIPMIEKLNVLSDGQADLDWFSDGLFLSGYDNQYFNLWVYLVRLGVVRAISFPDLKSAFIETDDNGSPLFVSTAIFE